MKHSLLPSFFWDDENWDLGASHPSNLSIYEEKGDIFVEAALPGITHDEVEVTLDKGILWIKGEKKEEEKDKEKKYYKKASRSFSYRVSLPEGIDESAEPEADFKDGIMRVRFKKRAGGSPKTISVKKL